MPKHKAYLPGLVVLVFLVPRKPRLDHSINLLEGEHLAQAAVYRERNQDREAVLRALAIGRILEIIEGGAHLRAEREHLAHPVCGNAIGRYRA